MKKNQLIGGRDYFIQSGQEGLSKEISCGQNFELSGRVSPNKVWKKCLLGRGENKYKSLKQKKLGLRKRKYANVVRWCDQMR